MSLLASSGSLLPQCRTQCYHPERSSNLLFAGDGKEDKSRCFVLDGKKSCVLEKGRTNVKKLILQCLRMPATLSTLITKGSSQGGAGKAKASIKAAHLCQTLSEQHPYDYRGCSEAHVKVQLLQKRGQGEKGNLSHPLPGGFDSFHIQIFTG